MKDKPLNILYVEDELSLATIVQESLDTRGYTVFHHTTAKSALEMLHKQVINVCVLDIMLPHMSGYDLAKEIRLMQPNIPIIFLTAKTQTKDVVKGFEVGGNDYLKKPFSMEELIVRIENLYRLRNGVQQMAEINIEEFNIAGFRFLPDKQELYIGHKQINLSHRESILLEILCQHQNQKCERKKILLQLWGDDNIYNSRNLDVYITRLRKRLTLTRAKIITLKGVGYLFKTE